MSMINVPTSLLASLVAEHKVGSTVCIKADCYAPAHIRPNPDSPMGEDEWKSYLLAEAQMHKDALVHGSEGWGSYAHRYVNFYIGAASYGWVKHYHLTYADGEYTFVEVR